MSKPMVWWEDATKVTDGQPRPQANSNAEATYDANAATFAVVGQTDPLPKASALFINFEGRATWKLRDIPVQVEGLSPDLKTYMLAEELKRERDAAEERSDAYIAWRDAFIAGAASGPTLEYLKSKYPMAPL